MANMMGCEPVTMISLPRQHREVQAGALSFFWDALSRAPASLSLVKTRL